MVCFRKHILVINISFQNGSFPNLAVASTVEKLSYVDRVAMETQ